LVSESEQEMQRYLKGAEYPASKGDLASVAKKNEAPQELVEQLRSLEETSFSEQGQEPGEFSNPEEVVEALERLGTPEDAET
jgi:hypothetical protein